MSLRLSFMLALSLVAAVACDGEEKKKSTGQAAAAAPEGAPCSGGQQGAGLACEPAPQSPSGTTPTELEGAAKGLAAGCAVKDKAKGSCVECTGNHDLAHQFCSDAKVDEASCVFKESAFQCATAGGGKLEGDTSKKSGAQKLYDNMSLIVTVAKLALTSKFEKEPAKGKILLGTLDVLDKYKKQIFTLQDLGPAVDEVAKIAKDAAPDKLDDAKLKVMKDQIAKTISSLQARAQSGQLTNADLLALASGWLGAVPKEALGGTDIGDLLTLLQTFSGNEADLAKILESVGGDGKATLTGDEDADLVGGWRK